MVSNSSTSSGDYGLATAATLASADALGLDAAGNLYVVEQASGAIRAIAGAGCLRASLHYLNLDEEIDRLLAALDALRPAGG